MAEEHIGEGLKVKEPDTRDRLLKVVVLDCVALDSGFATLPVAVADLIAQETPVGDLLWDSAAHAT